MYTETKVAGDRKGALIQPGIAVRVLVLETVGNVIIMAYFNLQKRRGNNPH